jgi:hypothetical protein
VKPTQAKWVVIAVVALLAIVTGVLLATQRAGDSGASGTVTLTTTVGPSSNPFSKPTDVYTPTPGSEPTGQRPPTNVPMTKLKPGEKPPQFVLFSFDGYGNSAKIHRFLDAAKASNARFTGFLSGVYLLEDSKASYYQAPGARRGASDVGWGGDAAEVIQRVNDLNASYLAGMELGTHYNGHFQALGANWSTAQWNTELDQFYDILANWKTINNLPQAPDLVFPPSEVKGGRTPGLAHILAEITASWKEHRMTYDSSQPAPHDGIFWPEKISGIWEFYMPQVYAPEINKGGRKLVTAMDYNMWVAWNGAVEDGSGPALTSKVLDLYRYVYNQAFAGGRPPVLIANHLNNWNGDAFNPAAEQFMREACVKPETVCATYQDVVAWMQLQDPAVLAALQNTATVAFQ